MLTAEIKVNDETIGELKLVNKGPTGTYMNPNRSYEGYYVRRDAVNRQPIKLVHNREDGAEVLVVKALELVLCTEHKK
jgi:hypothetical protein